MDVIDDEEDRLTRERGMEVERLQSLELKVGKMKMESKLMREEIRKLSPRRGRMGAQKTRGEDGRWSKMGEGGGGVEEGGGG